jgi:probable F420-dependent oxidoreductase
MSRSFKVGFRADIRTVSGTDLFDKQIALAEQAEAAGIDAIFFGDRLLARVARQGQQIYNSTAAEIFTSLAAVAARTNRIQLGTLVVVVPFRNPVQLAKIVASLDVLSKGRLILGVGAGWNDAEFGVFGFPRQQAARRMTEGVEVMQQLWKGQPVNYEGKYFKFDGIAVEPVPFQKPGPPIWLGSWLPFRRPLIDDSGEVAPQWDRVLARVGRMADGWAPLVYSIVVKRCAEPALIGQAWQRVQQHAAEAGRPGAVKFVYSHHFYAIENSQDEQHAREDLAIFTGTFEEAKQTYLMGSPDEIVERIRSMVSQVDRVDWYVLSALGPRPRQLELLQSQIIPRLEQI